MYIAVAYISMYIAGYKRPVALIREDGWLAGKGNSVLIREVVPMSMAELSRKCNYRKSLPPGSAWSVTKEYHTRVGLQMGMGLCPWLQDFTSEYETVCTSQQCV